MKLIESYLPQAKRKIHIARYKCNANILRMVKSRLVIAESHYLQIEAFPKYKIDAELRSLCQRKCFYVLLIETKCHFVTIKMSF